MYGSFRWKTECWALKVKNARPLHWGPAFFFYLEYKQLERQDVRSTTISLISSW